MLKWVNSHSVAGVCIFLVLAFCTQIFSFGGVSKKPAYSRENTFTVDTTRTFVFSCEDTLQFTARIQDSTLWIYLPDSTIQLKQVRSASGAKYRNGEIVFWNKGEQAVLRLNGALYEDCQNQTGEVVWEKARLAGADFRSTGHEPGWYLEVYQDSTIILVTDYGKHRYQFPAPAPEIDPGSDRTIYSTRAEEHVLKIYVTDDVCYDSATGRRYESSVTVIIDGRTLKGCGKPL